MTGPAGLTWRRQNRPVWDEDKQRIIAGAPAGVFDLPYRAGDDLPGDWWTASDGSGQVVAFGWMDLGWGEAEILLAVDPATQRRGIGSAVLQRLEQEAAVRGLNYVYNTVAGTHPDRAEMHDWLGVRGYRGSDEDRALRKKVDPPGTGGVAQPAGPRTPAAPGPPPDHPPGHPPGNEESGGYVDVEDHQY